ncbi:MAG: tryptophan/tyrosine permease [Legionellales bacterium RIFCSPHIGHO2_12_FULL_42_9]|nr:MAG: tryptophan/tyrosine permease [Legionellales bacterium RIFCSPHIGHO2_12_FULL_42_9]
MNSRFIGGILLIVGTSIGGGMLALPIANAATGFWQSSLFLLLCWAMMTLGALFILEVTLYLPPGNNMISMARETLGTPGLIIAWLSYLLLLYTLLCAYISGGADVFGNLANYINIHLNAWQSTLLFTIAFGLIVYQGIQSVDLVNRGLMFGKLGIYLLLVILIAPHTQLHYFEAGNYRFITSTVMILITSFGFAIIVPNLRVYFDNDIRMLRKVVLIGSFIPLLCYIAWDAVIIGSLPTEGPEGLALLMHAARPTSSLALILTDTIQNQVVTTLFHTFTSICMLTAFLGVSLCLVSFLADGLKVSPHGREGFGLILLTFTPPLVLVLFYPGAYIYALNYAGSFCVILLLLLPALMCIKGRTKFTPNYRVPGGHLTPVIVIAFSLVLLFNAVSHF